MKDVSLDIRRILWFSYDALRMQIFCDGVIGGGSWFYISTQSDGME